jgi:hypothetical protein
MDTVIDMAGAVARGWDMPDLGDKAIMKAMMRKAIRISVLREIMVILVPPAGLK